MEAGPVSCLAANKRCMQYLRSTPDPGWCEHDHWLLLEGFIEQNEDLHGIRRCSPAKIKELLDGFMPHMHTSAVHSMNCSQTPSPSAISQLPMLQWPLDLLKPNLSRVQDEGDNLADCILRGFPKWDEGLCSISRCGPAEAKQLFD